MRPRRMNAHNAARRLDWAKFGCSQHSFSSSVPRVRPNLALLAYGAAVSPSMGVADIRDWFPGEREIARGPVGRIVTARQMLASLEPQENASA